MKKLFCLLLMLMLLVSALPVQASTLEIRPLTEGVPTAEALAIAGGCAEYCGQTLDTSTLVFDGSGAGADAGIFTLFVDAVGGQAVGVTLSCSYLDNEYAQTMGKIFGLILSSLGDFEDPSVILNSLDYSVFDTLAANSQTLIYGDYKIIVKVDPESKTPYQLRLCLLNPPEAPAAANDAGAILNAMGADTSAVFVYDAETDPNGKLGQPGAYSSKVNFALRSIDPNAQDTPALDVAQGGSIEVFETPADAYARLNYVADTQITYFGGADHAFVCGSAYLRLSGDIDPAEAGLLIGAFIHVVQNPGVPAAAPTPAPLQMPEPAPALPQPGEIIEFGTYEQDGNAANGKEPIRWQVLKAEDGKVMLVSVYALDVYNTYWDSPTWDHSTLRAWLNDDFMNAAFSAEEQQRLAVTTVPAHKNPNYTSDPGSDTQDAVFCLSYPEAQDLLTPAERKAETTPYAKNQAKVYTEGNLCYWWLRTPGKPGCGASIVCTDGSFDYDLSYDGFSYGVRPAIWLEY